MTYNPFTTTLHASAVEKTTTAFDAAVNSYIANIAAFAAASKAYDDSKKEYRSKTKS
jgi:predicted metal-dependent peptidase